MQTVHEFDSRNSEVSLQDLRTSYEQKGFAVLSDVLDRAKVLSLRSRLVHELDRLKKDQSELDPECQSSLLRSEMPIHPEKARFRLDLNNYEHLTSSKKLVEVIRYLAGENFYWHYPTMFRSVHAKDVEGILPFHQDYIYNSRYKKMLVCWVPLDAAGVKAPGLELVGKNLKSQLCHHANGRWEHGLSEQDLVPILSEAEIHRPIVRPGDVIIFNDLTLHRTYASSEMTESRFSMDARAVPISGIEREIKEGRNFVKPDSPALVRMS